METAVPEPIIIDTDPGHDDAFAILLALASPELEVLGLTTVGGNVPLEAVTANARRVLELAGHGAIDVFAGAPGPLLRPAMHAADVHGETGIDGYGWPAPVHPAAPRQALDWMVETISARPATTLVTLGPLTNIALLLRRAPELAGRIRRIVSMGGGYFEPGNYSPAAEFNILVDPEAASIVYGAGIELVAMPIDCTNKALTPGSWIADLQAMGTRVGDACAGMQVFFERHGNVLHGTRTRPLHDAVAMAWLLWPELFSGRLCNVEVETASPLTLGATVVDWLGKTGRPKNCLWITECDAATMYARMLDRLRSLPAGATAAPAGHGP